jgi:hypothetical protein
MSSVRLSEKSAYTLRLARLYIREYGCATVKQVYGYINHDLSVVSRSTLKKLLDFAAERGVFTRYVVAGVGVYCMPSAPRRRAIEVAMWDAGIFKDLVLERIRLKALAAKTDYVLLSPHGLLRNVDLKSWQKHLSVKLVDEYIRELFTDYDVVETDSHKTYYVVDKKHVLNVLKNLGA